MQQAQCNDPVSRPPGEACRGRPRAAGSCGRRLRSVVSAISRDSSHRDKESPAGPRVGHTARPLHVPTVLSVRGSLSLASPECVHHRLQGERAYSQQGPLDTLATRALGHSPGNVPGCCGPQAFLEAALSSPGLREAGGLGADSSLREFSAEPCVVVSLLPAR